MKNSIKVAATLVLGLAMAGVGAGSIAFAAEPGSVVTIQSLQSKQPAVTFPHKAHLEKLKGKCKDCHTTDAGGALKPDFTDAKYKGQISNPYHTECLDCHKKAKGPVACGACHKK